MQDGTKLLSRALHCLHDGVAVVDADGAIAYANPALEELLGLPRGALVGKPVEELLWDYVGSRPPGKPLSLQGRTVRQGRLVHVSGERIPVRWSAILTSDPETGVFTTYVFHDLRPEIRAERLEDRLRHSEKLTLLGQVFGGLAHELNNPLTHIMIASEMLQTTGDPAKAEEHARKIQRSAERCRAILQNALRVAHKGEDGEAPTRKALDAPVREIVELVERPFGYDGVTVRLVSEPGCPEVPFDRGKLQQVVTNLLNNARDALAERGRGGKIRVRLGPTEDGALLEVEDDGPGIPEELRARVGRAFFTTKPAGKGTGLGLSICRAVVEEHGGTLELADSDLGGLRVTIRLPRDPSPSARSGARPVGVQGTRILVIDDDPDSLEALGQRFGSLGAIEVVSCASPGEALGHMAEQPFDLVVCDMRLPGMSGVTLYQIVCVAYPQLARRFLFVTGYPEDDAASGFLARQRLQRLTKPLDGASLQDAAEKVLFSVRDDRTL